MRETRISTRKRDLLITHMDGRIVELPSNRKVRGARPPKRFDKWGRPVHGLGPTWQTTLSLIDSGHLCWCVRWRSTAITEAGRAEVARILADHADALARAAQVAEMIESALDSAGTAGRAETQAKLPQELKAL